MKRVMNLIIVDESGSMCVIEKQALMGLNETLETVKKMQQLHPDMEQRVTLITFDSTHKRYIYDNVPVNDTHNLTSKDYNPGGATPLYDAIGIGISKMNAQTSPEDNVLVTIITDGEENCSEEYNLKMVKTLIEKMKKQNWTFTLIGTDNLDVEGMAGAMAIDNHLEFTEDEEGAKKMFAHERHSRARYNACVACDMAMPTGSYFEDEKKDRKRKR
jgi:Mg-chelatase subunit ChlD